MSIAIHSHEISLIIPVKDNQSGVNQFLTHFLETQTSDTYPKEIILVDNQSNPPLVIPETPAGFPIQIRLISCPRKGPGAARNCGASESKGSWLLFIDSDCIPTESSIRGFLDLQTHASAYIGTVNALGNDPVSNYYQSQKIHQPPEKVDGHGRVTPKYLITANFMIEKEVFYNHHGFNEYFTFACEDMDLGVRLEQKASMAFVDAAMVKHDYHDGFSGFIRRFYAYGKGNRLIRTMYKLPLFPLPFLPKDKSNWVNFGLAGVQWLCLFTGYLVMHVRLLTGKQPRIGNDQTQHAFS